MDSHTDDLDKLVADAEAEALRSQNEQPDQTLLGLAESVALVNNANVETNRSLQVALASIEAAPDRLALAVDSSLQQLENQKQQYQKATAELRSQNQRNWMTLVGGALILGCIAFSLLYFWLWPGIAEFKEYARDHRALEASSVFGARVVESNGDRFVLFDEGVTVQSNCSGRPNCISVETK